ncbi:hypothetical protein QJS66_10115 [Kocuria rhizophila]|nr:hypothetical protein QJS66_10115 [Kocuria rhizophila]
MILDRRAPPGGLAARWSYESSPRLATPPHTRLLTGGDRARPAGR